MIISKTLSNYDGIKLCVLRFKKCYSITIVFIFSTFVTVSANVIVLNLYRTIDYQAVICCTQIENLFT